jgi:hypothetical protein
MGYDPALLRGASILGIAGSGFILAPNLPFSLGIHGDFSYIAPLLVAASGLVFMYTGLGLEIAVGTWQLSWIRLIGAGYLTIGVGLTIAPIVNSIIYEQMINSDRLFILICGAGALWFGIRLTQRYDYDEASQV